MSIAKRFRQLTDALDALYLAGVDLLDTESPDGIQYRRVQTILIEEVLPLAGGDLMSEAEREGYPYPERFGFGMVEYLRPVTVPASQTWIGLVQRLYHDSLHLTRMLESRNAEPNSKGKRRGRKPDTERNDAILADRAAGMSRGQIARKYKTTTDAIRGIEKRSQGSK